MIEILVTRGAGDRPGPDISDPLITSVPVALARGSAEINRSMSDRRILSLDLTLMPWTDPGSLVGITSSRGRQVGRLLSMEKEYTVSASDFTAACRMSIEVVDER